MSSAAISASAALRTTASFFDVTLDEAKMRSIIEAKAVDIDAQLLESSIVVGEDSITLLKGASGMTLDTDSVFNSFRDAFLSCGSTSFTYESAPNTDETFDFQSLYNDIYSEVAEAEIVYNPDIETTDPGKDDGKGEKARRNARTHRDPRAVRHAGGLRLPGGNARGGQQDRSLADRLPRRAVHRDAVLRRPDI